MRLDVTIFRLLGNFLFAGCGVARYIHPMVRKNLLSLVVGALLLSACQGEQSYVGAPPWRESDKHLNCDQLLLEINDARFWQTLAADNKKAGVMDIIWPVSYINQRASAQEALNITSSRISHLTNIYKIKGCDQPYPNIPMPRPALP
jgi:hypothetical protein